MEQEGSWGLLLDEPPGEEGPGSIHWVGDRLPEEVHPVFSAEEEPDTWCTMHGDSEVYWSYVDGDWWTEDPEGVWWSWSDAKPWFDVNEAMVVDPTAGKELQEALTLYQDKVRTFKESRQLVAARNTARGFYPLSGAKGKGKGKSKGKPSFGQKGGKGKGKKGTPPATSVSSSSAALAAEGPQRPGNAGYTGCFICGSKDHNFRRCPKRGSGKGAGSANLIGDGSWAEAPTYMVQSVPEDSGATEATETATDYDQAFVVQPASREPEDTVEEPENQEPLCFMHVMDGNPADGASLGGLPVEAAMSVAGQLHPGYAVIDSGATETVGSLEAIEAVVSMRRSRYGMESVRVFPEAKRSFRFGNAQQETATSYVEVPQTLAGRPVSLGVFALDVPRIPILLSIRTLRKLGAEINFQRRTIVFQAVDPGVTIGVQESASGHLLLDLVHDWMRTPGASQSFSGTVLSQVLSGYKEGVPCEREPGGLHRHINHGNLQQQPRGPEPPEQHEGQDRCSAQSVVQVPCSVLSAARHHVHEREAEHVSVDAPPHAVPSHVPVFDMTAADETSRELMGTYWSRASPRQPSLRDHGDRADRDPRHGQPGAASAEGQSQGQGQGKERQGEDRVRHVTGDRSRSEGPEDSRAAVPRQPCANGGRQGQLVGSQRPWALGSVQGLSSSPPLCSGLWRARSLPPGWAIAGGHQEGGGDRGGARRSGRAEGQGHLECEGGGAAGSRGLSPTSARDGALAKHPEGEGGRLPQGHGRREPRQEEQSSATEVEARTGSDPGLFRLGQLWHGGCERPPAHPQEECQASQCQGCRGPGGSSKGGRSVDQGQSSGPRGLNIDEDGLLSAEGVLAETQAGTIREAMKEILANFDADVAELPQHRSGIHLVEVGSSGASGLRAAVEDRHGNAARMSPYEFDFGRKSGLEHALEAARSLAPALMWVAVPCVALEAPEDSVAGADEEQRRTQLHRRRRARKVLKTSLKLAEDQMARGGHVAWEWPASSGAWKEPEMKGFLRQLAKRGMMCTTVFQDKAAGKRWRIMTSSPELRKMIDHAQAETSEKKGPASMSRSLSVSSRYPPRLCRAVAEFALWADHRGGEANAARAFGLSDEPLLESKLDPADRKRAEALVHRLHVRAGHPSGKTLAKVLKARGAHHEVIKIAMEHTCPDCQEMRLPDLAPSVSLQQSEVPWKVIQIDNAEVRVDDVVTHFMVITDEATHFAVVAKLFERNFQDGRNATAEEAILALEQSWTQAYGFPDRIRCDPEGCFRSKLLEAWASDLGIEVTPCPAEAHHQIGQVESLVKKLKQDAITLLAGHPVGAHRALLHSAAAHNTVHRVQGFSPAQWAFGRDFGPGGRLFESEQDLPVVQNSVLQGHTFHDHMEVRRAAEDIARRSQATYQLGRMLNMKSRRKLQFVPGDLVYYRRVQPPADAPAHPGLGFAKVGLGRWFGPGRVLATETRSDHQGSVRKPAQTVWIIANGRLKRCSPDQLRHASEREAAIAEATDAATPPWTFSSLLQTLESGGYDVFDDYVFPEDIGALPQVPRGRSRARSRTPGRETMQRDRDEGVEKQGRSAQNPTPRAPGGPPESSVDGRAGGLQRHLWTRSRMEPVRPRAQLALFQRARRFWTQAMACCAPLSFRSRRPRTSGSASDGTQQRGWPRVFASRRSDTVAWSRRTAMPLMSLRKLR